MKRVLWIGDAVVSSGFARATHHILDTVKETFDVHVLGINYNGDPHAYPYPIYPCWPGKDLFGVGRVRELVQKVRPDLIVIQNDPWNFPEYLAHTGSVPVVGVVAVDGKNCRGRGLNKLAKAIFWTEFGATEARQGGYTGSSAIIPLGVDTALYNPKPRLESRQKTLEDTLEKYPELSDAFIIGNVNRNQPRKRLDLSLMYFAEWIKSRGIRDAYFYFHTAPTGDVGYEIPQLAQYLGVADRLILSEPSVGFGVPEDELPYLYSSFDAMLTTTQGEGFGLTTMEGMACGVPQIVPDWSALGELCQDAALVVPCTSMACTIHGINVIGGIADKDTSIAMMDALYESKHGQMWERVRRAGLKRVQEPRFDWKNIGLAYVRELSAL